MRHPLFRQPCIYCGQPSAAEDHIVPRSQGGTLTAPSCTPCNSSKGARTPTEWVKALLVRVARGERRGIAQLHRMMPHLPNLERSGILNARELSNWYQGFREEQDRVRENVALSILTLLGLDDRDLPEFEECVVGIVPAGPF